VLRQLGVVLVPRNEALDDVIRWVILGVSPQVVLQAAVPVHDAPPADLLEVLVEFSEGFVEVPLLARLLDQAARRDLPGGTLRRRATAPVVDVIRGAVLVVEILVVFVKVHVVLAVFLVLVPVFVLWFFPLAAHVWLPP
jgi:hypothetical protein